MRYGVEMLFYVIKMSSIHITGMVQHSINITITYKPEMVGLFSTYCILQASMLLVFIDVTHSNIYIFEVIVRLQIT
jgi:hypothetical protein